MDDLLPWLTSHPRSAWLIGLAVIIALAEIAIWVLASWARRSKGRSRQWARLRAPLSGLIPSALCYIALQAAPRHWIEKPWRAILFEVLAAALTIFIAWTLVRLVRVIYEFAVSGLDVGTDDNLRARRLLTQFVFARRVAGVLIVLLTLGIFLMRYEGVRALGAGLFASAGVAGLVLGVAAQRVLGNFFAGALIAITQPIRVDDVVIVEGEWGRIEEITMTYVVVAIWDKRRLIVPLAYFLERPFQNWTRTSSALLGPIMLYLDWRAPIGALREELARILDGHEAWDGEAAAVQVTDTSERTITVRVLVSARDASRAWELRCEVRERLIAFIQREYPASLPRLRGELEGEELGDEVGQKGRREA